MRFLLYCFNRFKRRFRQGFFGFWGEICVLSVYISYTQKSLSKRMILVIELQNLCGYRRICVDIQDGILEILS